MSTDMNNAVLLVDDKKYILEMLETVCSSINRPSYVAENGEEALEVYKQHSNEISLVISDMVMPKMDGKELFFKLRENHPDIKVILCSGYPIKEDVKQYIESGQIQFLKKPYEMSQLLNLLVEH